MLTVNTNDPITLHQGDYQVTYSFLASPCTSSTANDGTIPYGTTVSSVSLIITDDNGDTVNDLVDGVTVSDNVIYITMTYPAAGDGRYKIRCIMTLDSGTKIEWMTYVYCRSH